ncbi:MAG TPA: DUF2927 domain-containing protein [Xanthobacteraceae bacterium]|jgi:hypothetical protein|nr:DUF2927 domain-containing protein [Xanthobacteraceae bacterium]
MTALRERRYAGRGAPTRRVAAVALILCLGSPLTATRAQNIQDKEISARRAAESKTFTDAQIVEGFFKVTFGAEFHTAGRIDRIRKFDGPIRVYVDNRARPDRSQQLNQVIDDIRSHVDKLDIALTGDRQAANVVITLIRDRDLGRTITGLFGREHSRKIQSALEPQCLAGFQKDDSYRIIRSEVVLVVDVGDFIFYDCAYEEILQALGPINDDESVPWTMFNDDVQMGFFDLYDQYLLNLLYHARIRPGMTRDEARVVVAEILPDVRAFVAQANDLKP